MREIQPGGMWDGEHRVVLEIGIVGRPNMARRIAKKETVGKILRQPDKRATVLVHLPARISVEAAEPRRRICVGSDWLVDLLLPPDLTALHAGIRAKFNVDLCNRQQLADEWS